MSAPAVPVLRSATAADADAVRAVRLASRAAAVPWSPVVHTPAQTRWWVERALLSRCRDGRDDEEHEPDVTYAWRP